MAPTAKEDCQINEEAWDYVNQIPQKENKHVNKYYEWKIRWDVVVPMIDVHLSACYGFYLMFTSAKLATLVFAYVLHMISVLGELGGAHRLWSHRSFKACFGLRVFLMLAQSLSFSATIFRWARDHRVHHKFSDTDADPHNSKRGFFYSHIGWHLIHKSPLTIEKGRNLDLSDLYEDPVVMFQRRYQHLMNIQFAIVLPALLPVILWSESLICSAYIAVALRWVVHAHGTWLINSAAHTFGNKPYDRNIQPTENSLVTWSTLGEGWHNYHHSFPWDYRAAELGNYGINFTSWFISWCAMMGWAWDLKTANHSMVQQRVKRTGDGTHGRPVWGWGDKDMTLEDKNLCT